MGSFTQELSSFFLLFFYLFIYPEVSRYIVVYTCSCVHGPVFCMFKGCVHRWLERKDICLSTRYIIHYLLKTVYLMAKNYVLLYSRTAHIGLQRD